MHRKRKSILETAEGVTADLDSSGDDTAGGDGGETSNMADLIEGGDGPRSARDYSSPNASDCQDPLTLVTRTRFLERSI